MNHSKRVSWQLIFPLFIFCWLTLAPEQLLAQTTFGGNAQHTGIFTPAVQPLNVVKWQTDIDLNNTGALAHYGSPVISANNTVFVPVKTSNDGFRVDVFDGATGAFKYTVATDYIMPAHNWLLPYNICIVGTRLYFAGAGGTMWHIDNIDSNSPTAPVREVFYTTLSAYNANATVFNNTIFVNTPITADSAGNIFFGFRVQGTAPSPLNSMQSGLARINPAGAGSFVFVGTAANDPLIDLDSHNAGPALSNDETSIYFPVKASNNAFYCYLVELNSTTLTTKHSVFLKDPRNGSGARITDDSTSTPMVAPDGDVYFGVFGNSGNGSRGFLLRFSSDLSITKTPGAFGWDYTPAIVPSSMVSSYNGTSSYLLFSKYNDYAFQDGSGVNRVAILDPNSTQIDPHSTANGLVEMREVLTIIGPTPDDAGPTFPFAVQEFCINAPAVNPATNSVFFDSEDGHIYRWNLATNSLDQSVVLSPGIGQPYVPTVIGPDGTLYTLNGGVFFAVGPKPGVALTITSSSPDVRNTVVGETVTFTATVTGNLPNPTGTVTFSDLSYNGVSPVTITLASNVPIDANGHASISTSTLVASGINLGNHFITATYNGDAGHTTSSVTMVQKIHPSGTNVTVTSSVPQSVPGQNVTFTATVTGTTGGLGSPTGMLTFLESNTVLSQLPLNSSGVATFTTSNLSLGFHRIEAVYASDTLFGASTGQVGQIVGPAVSFASANASASEATGAIVINVVRTGDSSGTATVDYATSDIGPTNACNVISDHAGSRCDYLVTTGTLTFAPGETSKPISVPIVDDSFAEGAAGETFNISLQNASGAAIGSPAVATLTINDNDAVNGPNPLDSTSFFVRQHYLDFLNREPDMAGFDFWKHEIDMCGSDPQCIEVKRNNVSAAFFVSIEFQETGYLVYRIYKSAFNNLPGAPVPVVFSDFIRDTQKIGKGFEVNVGDWQTQLEANKQAFLLAFVQRPDFRAAFPDSMVGQEFVDKLNQNAGNVLSASERANLVGILGATPTDFMKRAQVLRGVAEDTDLRNAEFNKAFVLMQYFGYLRRNPNEAPDGDFSGYTFWLDKLNLFNGNYITAEMVKAFISSDEYRHRFGP